MFVFQSKIQSSYLHRRFRVLALFFEFSVLVFQFIDVAFALHAPLEICFRLSSPESAFRSREFKFSFQTFLFSFQTFNIFVKPLDTSRVSKMVVGRLASGQSAKGKIQEETYRKLRMLVVLLQGSFFGGMAFSLAARSSLNITSVLIDVFKSDLWPL